jgi:hypothetical protein
MEVRRLYICYLGVRISSMIRQTSEYGLATPYCLPTSRSKLYHMLRFITHNKFKLERGGEG